MMEKRYKLETTNMPFQIYYVPLLEKPMYAFYKINQLPYLFISKLFLLPCLSNGC